MPKIVDHDKKRQEIALKSTAIFLEHGYKNIGMRQLCDKLEMSKSAVYYYYKTKDELFRAATEAIVNLDEDVLAGRPLATSASITQKLENFTLIFKQMAPRFFQEMKLVSDYIDVIGIDNIAEDPCMQLANQKYLTMLTTYVSAEHSNTLYTILLGLLNHQTMIGTELDTDYVVAQASRCLQ
ncbi:TetR/AcrR family transcriptional regulator [Photobacterium sanguinicancri]|uniref:TetR/AcrR family transcriptional regulator n=1 Tax=Photobacterium sanguinicancri TaxID=875932 RepID=UPI0026E352E9|nr:TetR/AcrR family transcriptional regulator [Photobacterium sanguinicancri]MDO6498945.1 TetR/AcrR family transcriptional regulator [Photobacterium sanguinicancri]